MVVKHACDLRYTDYSASRFVEETTISNRNMFVCGIRTTVMDLLLNP